MNDKSTWIKRVRKRGLDLKDAPTQLLGDEDVVCAAVKKHWRAFQYASPLLQNDKKFFMEKLIPLSEDSPWALKYASDELQKDKEVVKKAVHYNYLSFQFANSELKDDRDFVKELVQLKKIRSGYPPAFALGYASIRVQNDKEVVLAAVKNWGALQFASDELRNDKEVVREAIRDWGGHFEFASEELLNDREFCLECVKMDEDAFEHVSDNLKEEYGKTKDEFMKNKSEHNPISESMKNEGKKKENDTMESVVRAEEEPRAVSMPKSLLKKIDRTTVTESIVRAEEPDRISMSDSMETKEYRKQIEELKNALYGEKKERKAEVDALKVELENQKKLAASNKSEVKKLNEGNSSLNKQLEELKNILKEMTKKNEKIVRKVNKEKEDIESLYNFERTLVGTNLTDYVIKEEIHRGQNGVVCEAYLNRRKLSMKICYVFGYKMTPQLWKEKVRPEFLFKLPIHPNLLRIHYCGVGNVDRDTPVGHSNYGL